MDLPSPETMGVRERRCTYELQGVAMEALRSALTGRGVCPTFLAFIAVAAEVEQAMEGLGFPD